MKKIIIRADGIIYAGEHKSNYLYLENFQPKEDAKYVMRLKATDGNIYISEIADGKVPIVQSLIRQPGRLTTELCEKIGDDYIALSGLFIFPVFDSIRDSADIPPTYEAAKTLAERAIEAAEMAEHLTFRLLEGVRWAALGDSFTRGFGVVDIGEKTYSDYISDRTGIGCINLGEDGMSYTGNFGRKILDRLGDVPENVDIITICAGLNDIFATLGSVDDDAGTNSFYGAVKNTILEFIKNFPSVPIGIITPIHVNDSESDVNYNELIEIRANAIKEICGLYAVPCLDLFSSDGLYFFNEDIRKIYFNNFPGVDTLHPNTNGHKRVASIIEPWLKSLV